MPSSLSPTPDTTRSTSLTWLVRHTSGMSLLQAVWQDLGALRPGAGAQPSARGTEGIFSVITRCTCLKAGAEWVALRVLAYLYRPFGLRFTRDGAGLAVTCSGNNSATIISAVDGSLVRLIASGLCALGDIEECEGGWLVVVCDGFTKGLEFVSNDGVTRAKLMLNLPVSLALVPGLGLLVMDNGLNRISVFWTADMVAMDAMSAPRVAWCSAVARAK